MAEVKILDTRKVPSLGEGRLGRFDRLVTYQEAPGRNFLLVLPDETFNDGTLVAAIRKDVEERGKHVGRTIQI